MDDLITHVASKSLSAFVLRFYDLSKIVFWMNKKTDIELTLHFVSTDNDKMISLSQENNIVISW